MNAALWIAVGADILCAAVGVAAYSHDRVFPLRRDSASELIRFAAENAPKI